MMDYNDEKQLTSIGALVGYVCGLGLTLYSYNPKRDGIAKVVSIGTLLR